MRCALAISLCCVLCVSAWGQAAPSLSIDLPPGVLGQNLPEPIPVWRTASESSGTLSGASSELDSIATELELLLSRLDQSLARAGIYQDASERSLASSISSATISIDSLVTSQEALHTAMRARDVELWIWRGGTALASVLAILAALWR